ncbi:DUF4123 domain-containing protein [Paraburkholderia ginsengiterrae]|uniref:DUF4123 domain-containing protein n=1 Tax=Paraburkholderia ginsengiterrae TaxID=1462993 RepID=UPI0013F4D336|nr:DUF4123 domain-containing protein [Paraburkholderia ginsengiterrae]
MRRFALVDCAVETPSIYRELLQRVELAGARSQCLFTNQREASLAHVGPWLIDVPEIEATRELFSWLMLIESKYPAISWLVAKVDFETLFAHLESQIDLMLPDGSRGMHRFWDPRAWSRFQRVLTMEQRVAFMGPVLEWKVALKGKTHQISRVDAECNLLEEIIYVDADA